MRMGKEFKMKGGNSKNYNATLNFLHWEAENVIS